jgi:peptidoglycan hydrolase-like protein with peptidoglycan-binding domain
MHKLGQPSLPNRVYQFYKRVTRKRYSKIILYMSITKIAAAVAGITLAALASTASAQTTTCYSFTLNHKLGNVGGEVMMVQKFLNMSAATQIAATGAGSAGLETTRFGGLTKAAVAKFQAANGVSPVSGYWGPLTRAKANALEAARCANNNNSNNNTTPATGDATLAAAPQPGNSLAPAGAARVPFTKFTVTAGSTAVTLNSVTVERGGLASDTAFANVILLDDMGNQLGTEKVLNSNHQATIGTPVVIPAGSTKTFTVAANMATSTTTSAGQVAVFSVVSANASGTVERPRSSISLV